MKSKPRTPFENFTRVMDGLMRVPHSALKAVLDKEKRENTRKKRTKITSASGRVSDDKG